MSKNTNLHGAKKTKNDEFYTQRSDIERAMIHYRKQFVGKIILCNCDDPEESNFWKYFYDNFDYLMLNGLISTHYEEDKPSYKLEVYRDETTGVRGRICRTPLKGNGDFRSDECIELLKQSDIVITNPPFSLFREYVAQLMEYDKKFVIIGNQNAITYKEIFPLIRDNRLWLGAGFNGGNAYFAIKPGTEDHYAKGVYNPETGLVKFRNCVWYTNMDLKKRHEELFLFRHYHGKDHDMYPKYDNYDAIEVSKVVDIPCDYDGVMGVPITFLNSYNPEQFEIVAFRKGDDGKDLVFTRERERENSTVLSYPCATSIAGMIKNAEGKIGGRITYARITIRRKQSNQ